MQVSLGDVRHSNTEEFRFFSGRDGDTDFLVVAECSLRSRKSFQIALDGSVTHDFQIPVSIRDHGLGKFDVVDRVSQLDLSAELQLRETGGA